MRPRVRAGLLAGLAAAALAPAAAPAAELETPLGTATLTTRLSFRTALELRDGGGQLARLELEPRLELPLPGEGRLTAVARLRADPLDRLEPGRVQQDERAPASRRLGLGRRAELELRELYADLRVGPVWLTAGKQQIVWGQADGLKVLDVVNPMDLREFILEDFEQSRIPLWSLRAELPVGGATAQLVWVPDASVHDLPPADGAFALGPAVEVRRPSSPFADSDVGARLAGVRGGVDWALVYLYRHDDAPRLVRDASGGLVARYERTHLVGGSFSTAFGDLTVRGELAWQSARALTALETPAGRGSPSAELAYVLGLDWYGIRRTLVSVQLFQSWLTAPRLAADRGRLESTLTLLVRRTFRHETVHARLLWLHALHGGDGVIRPRIAWDANDSLRLLAGVDVFYGPDGGFFGRFGDRSRAVLGAEWTF